MPTVKKPVKRLNTTQPPDAPQPALKPGAGSWHYSQHIKPPGKTTSAGTAHVTSRFVDLGNEARQQMELLFAMPITSRILDTLHESEDYWYRKDLGMRAYLCDWPTSKWLIDPEAAAKAVSAMAARQDLRKAGKSVFSSSIYSWWPWQADLKVEKQLEGDKVHFEPIGCPVPTTSVPEPPQAKKAPPPRPRPLTKPTGVVKTQASERPLRHSMPAVVDTAAQLTPVDSTFGEDDDFLLPVPKSKQTHAKARGSDASDMSFDARRIRGRTSKSAAEAREQTPPPYQSDGIFVDPNGDFPWQAPWAAWEPEEWTDDIYDPLRLKHLEQVQARNKRIVSKYMMNVKEGANSRRNAAASEASRPEDEEDFPPAPDLKVAERSVSKRSKLRKPRASDSKDTFSGRLVFADAASEAKFEQSGYEDFEDAVEAAMSDPYNTELSAIEVAHDPGDSIIADLELPRITLMDIARTRLQLQHIKVLTDRTAERVVDFCPELLCGYTVLQIASETKYSNTAIQVRLGSNGCMLSDSTITKRVSAALSRDYDKTGSKAAAEKNADYKKINRQTYDKYKLWRATRRCKQTIRPSTFDLSEQAAAFRQLMTVKRTESPEVFVHKKPAKTSKRKSQTRRHESDEMDETLIKNEDEDEDESMLLADVVHEEGVSTVKKTRAERLNDRNAAVSETPTTTGPKKTRQSRGRRSDIVNSEQAEQKRLAPSSVDDTKAQPTAGTESLGSPEQGDIEMMDADQSTAAAGLALLQETRDAESRPGAKQDATAHPALNGISPSTSSTKRNRPVAGYLSTFTTVDSDTPHKESRPIPVPEAAPDRAPSKSRPRSFTPRNDTDVAATLAGPAGTEQAKRKRPRASTTKLTAAAEGTLSSPPHKRSKQTTIQWGVSTAADYGASVVAHSTDPAIIATKADDGGNAEAGDGAARRTHGKRVGRVSGKDVG